MPPLAAESWVYLGARNGFVKIGVSVDPARRARELGLVILRTWPGDRATERALHDRLRAHRIDREWFMANPEVLDLMKHRDLD